MKVDRHHDPVIELESRLLSELDFIAQQLRGKITQSVYANSEWKTIESKLRLNMMYEIKMKILFKVREFVWVIVSEIEDWVYPYRDSFESEEEKYEHGMKDPMTGEITMIENLLQADNERIQRLQDEMINVQNRVYEIEDNLKSINTYSKKSNQINPNEGQESSEKDY